MSQASLRLTALSSGELSGERDPEHGLLVLATASSPCPRQQFDLQVVGEEA